MQLLVSTHNYLAVVCARTHRVSPVLHTPGSDFFYGITQTPSGEILVAQTKTGEIWAFDRLLRQRELYLRVKADPAPNVHQILCWQDRLYATVTHVDKVHAYVSGTMVSEIDLSGAPTIDERHPNSLNLNGDALLAVSHNRALPSIIHRLTLSLHEVDRMCVGKKAHNVWMRGENIYVLSSGTDQVLRCDPRRNVTCVHVFGPRSWARGFAESSLHSFVGLSPGADRDQRGAPMDAQIHVYDRHWSNIDVIRLPAAGQVHEIRLLNEPDAGHAGQTIDCGMQA